MIAYAPGGRQHLWATEDTRLADEHVRVTAPTAASLTLSLTAIHSREVAGAMSIGPGVTADSVYTASSCRMYPPSAGMMYRTIVAALPPPPECRSHGLSRQGDRAGCC